MLILDSECTHLSPYYGICAYLCKKNKPYYLTYKNGLYQLYIEKETKALVTEYIGLPLIKKKALCAKAREEGFKIETQVKK